MVKIRNYGVGTGYTSNGITGKKSVFAHDEKVYACHVWDEVFSGASFRIDFQRKVGTSWVTEVSKFWQNPDYTSIYHWAWIQNHTPGSWRARFMGPGAETYYSYFTIEPKETEIGEIWTITSPLGASVYLDNVYKGVTATGGLLIPNLSPGSYVVKFTLEGYKDYLIDVIVKAWEQTQVSRTLVPIPEPEPEPPPPEKTWWQKLLEILTIPWQIDWLREQALFSAAYKAFTGNDLTEEEYVRTKAELLDWILPINLSSILFYGKNLKGEAVEFADTETYIELAALALMFTPIRFIGKLGSKIGLKIGGKGVIKVAGRMGLKKATPEAIEAMIKSGNYEWIFKAARTDPTAWARLAGKLSKEAQAIISAGLKKAHPAAAYRLFEEAILHSELAKRTLSAKTIDFVAKHKALGIVSVLGAAWGIIGFEAFTNWPLADNLGFLEYKSAEAVEEAYERGDITREKALEEMDKIIVILQAAYDKIKVSASWNPLMIAFGKPFVLIAEENLDLALRTKERIEALEPPKPTGTLIIRPTPSDAKVSVEGQIPTTGIFSVDLPIGTYSFTVSKFGYLSFTGTAEIQEGLTTEADVKLEEEVVPPVPPEEMEGKLIISVIPEDVLIEVSGQEEITTAGEYELLQGFYNIKASKEGFETQITTAYVRAQEETRISLILKEIIIPPEISIIRIESDPIAAAIFIDGVTTFNITNTSLQIEPGAHTLTLKKKEYIDVEVEFEIKEGESLSFKLTLEAIPVPPAPVPATIRITSEPTDADIYIDGVYTFTTTPYTVLLDAGSYYIRVQKEGYYPKEILAEVEEAEVDEILIQLDILLPDAPPQPPYIPYDPVYPAGYEFLYPESMAPPGFEPTTPPEEKELLVNIETTDAKPWKGRIYSIAFHDLSVPGIEPVILVNDNEEELLTQFLDIFNSLLPARLIGFKLTFDHRYIFHKIMNYRMQSKKWAEIELKDVKQLMDQVKEEFVYFPDKTGTLDDYGKSLLGKGKYGTQKEILKQFLAKNYDYVKAFQERQLEITNGLYQLFRFSSAEGFTTPVLTPVPGSSVPETPISTESPIQTGQKQCSSCKAFNPIENKECFICHQVLGP